MPDLTIANVFVRLSDGNYPLVRERLSSAFPDLMLSSEPSKGDEAFKVYVGYYPPQDEDIASYDWIHIPAAGVDRIVAELEGKASTPVITRTIGRMGEQIGEYCLAYALAHYQKMALRREFEAERNWWKKKAAPDHLFDKTVGILGTGYIGQGIGRAFRALGSAVIGYSRSGRPADPFDSVHKLSDFPGPTTPDILISALPWTAETEGLIDADLLSQLKDAVFINIGRGATLDENALKAALDAGQVSHAILDVFPKEPLAQEHWFWTDDRVTVTPHVSGLTRDVDAADRIVDLLTSSLKTGSLPETEVDLSLGY